MIQTGIKPDFADLARRLTAKADALARARAEETRRATAADPLRWREPRLLWPLFTKG